jgi:hypothetical protein
MNTSPLSFLWAVGLAVLPGLSACLFVSGFFGCEPGGQTPSITAGDSTIVNGTPVVQVTGERAKFDLGTIRSESKHHIIFVIHNNSDTSLKIKSIRGDCSCIRPTRTLESIAAGQVAQVEAVFRAPDIQSAYGSELIVLTDNPSRKMIHLVVVADIRR